MSGATASSANNVIPDGTLGNLPNYDAASGRGPTSAVTGKPLTKTYCDGLVGHSHRVQGDSTKKMCDVARAMFIDMHNCRRLHSEGKTFTPAQDCTRATGGSEVWLRATNPKLAAQCMLYEALVNCVVKNESVSA